MGKYCKFCGTATEGGVCPNEHVFKKMCVNCAHSKEEDESYFCNNLDNMKTASNKIAEAIKNAGVEAYEVEFNLKPVALKKPTLKCSKWELSNDVLSEIQALFK